MNPLETLLLAYSCGKREKTDTPQRGSGFSAAFGSGTVLEKKEETSDGKTGRLKRFWRCLG